MGDDTSIRVSEELADVLYSMKDRGESYEDVIWRLLDRAGEDDIATDDSSEQAERTGSQPRDPHTSAEEEPAAGPSNADKTGELVSQADRDRLREELAGSGELLEARVDEIVKMYQALREHGDAEKDDLLDAVDVDATGYQDRESVWANMVKGRDTLRSLPGVETPPAGRTTWRYKGENDG